MPANGFHKPLKMTWCPTFSWTPTALWEGHMIWPKAKGANPNRKWIRETTPTEKQYS